MTWWNSFVSWLSADSNQPVVFGAVVVFISIVVAGVLAAWISRGAIRRLLEQRDRELKAAVIGALVDASTEASVWNSLTPQEQVMADRAVGQADIQLRLLPIRGAAVAANWAAHQLADLKRTSATFGYQLEPAVLEFRDRMIDWQNKPARARKIFQGDLDRWKLQNTASEKSLLAEQDAWVAQQHHDEFALPDATPTHATYADAPVDRTPVEREPMEREPAPVSYSSSAADGHSSPSTETQRLLDDVQALDVRAHDGRPAEPLPRP